MSKPNQAVIDTVQANGNGGFGANGSLAAKLLKSNFNVNALRTNDLLQKDEWIKFDEEVTQVAREKLVAIADLYERGLTFELTNALGITKVEWQNVSDFGPASVSMGATHQTENTKVTYELLSIPVPIVHKDFFIDIRTLEGSRNRGESLDVTQASLAAKVVAETIEGILFAGSTVNGTSNQIYGYTNHPDRNTGSVTTASWLTQAASTTTAGTIITDVLAMIGKAVGDNMTGPYMLYVPTATYVALGNDYKANGDRTILQRIKDIPGIIDVKPTNKLATSNVVLVQMTRDVVDVIDGIQPTTVMWDTNGGMTVNFKVMAIIVPRIKSDKADQSGIVHYS